MMGTHIHIIDHKVLRYLSESTEPAEYFSWSDISIPKTEAVLPTDSFLLLGLFQNLERFLVACPKHDRCKLCTFSARLQLLQSPYSLIREAQYGAAQNLAA